MEKILIFLVVIALCMFGFQFVQKKFSGPNKIEQMHQTCINLEAPVKLEDLKKLFGELYGSANASMFRFNNIRYAAAYTDEIHGVVDAQTDEVSQLWCSDTERLW